MNVLAALKFPMVTKQVQEFLVVSFPDLEITVSETLFFQGKIKKDYVAILARLQNRALELALEKLARLEELKKSHYRLPSYIQQSLQQQTSELLSTKLAAKFLGVSERTLRRWESAGQLRASKTLGGHRSFEMGELTRFKQALSGHAPVLIKEP